MSAAAAAGAPGGRSSEEQIARRETLVQLVRSPTFVAGALILGFWIVCALFGTMIAPHDPLAQSDKLLVSPRWGHLFGTDQLGRDVLSRVLAGARSIMTIAPAATLLSIAGGTIVGLLTGFLGGVVDDVVSRIIDAVLAVPLIVVAVTVVAGLARSNMTLVVVIGVVFTPIVGRTVRAAVLSERQLDYVESARLRGEGTTYVMFVEILPNIMGPIIVEATVRLGYAIFAVAGLTFLGFGVQPPSPDWALQISANYTLLSAGTYWWTVLFPALAIASLVVAVNLVADGISGVLDR